MKTRQYRIKTHYGLATFDVVEAGDKYICTMKREGVVEPSTTAVLKRYPNNVFTAIYGTYYAFVKKIMAKI